MIAQCACRMLMCVAHVGTVGLSQLLIIQMQADLKKFIHWENVNVMVQMGVCFVV